MLHKIDDDPGGSNKENVVHNYDMLEKLVVIDDPYRFYKENVRLQMKSHDMSNKLVVNNPCDSNNEKFMSVPYNTELYEEIDINNFCFFNKENMKKTLHENNEVLSDNYVDNTRDFNNQDILLAKNIEFVEVSDTDNDNYFNENNVEETLQEIYVNDSCDLDNNHVVLLVEDVKYSDNICYFIEETLHKSNEVLFKTDDNPSGFKKKNIVALPGNDKIVTKMDIDKPCDINNENAAANKKTENLKPKQKFDWICNKCGQVFGTKGRVKKHNVLCKDHTAVLLSFNNIKPNAKTLKKRCGISKIFSKPLLHCEFCNDIYGDIQTLLRHEKTHSCSKNYECKVCGLRLTTYIYANIHWNGFCRNANGRFKLPRQYVCKICKKLFRTHKQLYAHIKREKHYCPKLYLTEEGEKITSKKNDQKRYMYQCEQCGQVFDNISELVLHRKQKHDKTLFICELCAHTVHTEKSLRLHHNAVHENNRKFLCQFCTCKFYQSSHLYRHLKCHGARNLVSSKYTNCSAPLKTKHILDTSIKCKICNNTFQTQSNLRRHIAIHLEEKKYKCHVCEKMFLRYDSYVSHCKSHDKNKVTYKCQYCERTYCYKSNLNKHISQKH